jgi:hypothetical protein
MTLWTNIFFFVASFHHLATKENACNSFKGKLPVLKLPDKFQHVAKTYQGSKTFLLFSLTYSQIWLSSLVDDGSSTYCGWNPVSKYGDFRK